MADLRSGLLLFARGFIDLVLSPGGLAIHRVVIAETTRFPELGRLFFRSGPDLVQERLGALLREATEAGLLEIPDIRLAGEQFVAMVQQPLHLRRLLDIPDRTAPEAVERVLESAVTAFLRAYGRAVQA
jgi:hypothetical protein